MMGMFGKLLVIFCLLSSGIGYTASDLAELTNGKSSFRDLGDDYSVSFPVRRVHGARLVLFNDRVAKKLGLDVSDLKKLEKQILALCAVTTGRPDGAKRQMFATRYLDYSVQDLEMLGNPGGDGRVAWAGELQLKRPDGTIEYLDITLKGIGRTPLAREQIRSGLFGKGEVRNLQYSDGLQTMEEAVKSFIVTEVLLRNGLDTAMDLAVIEIPTEKIHPQTKKVEKAAITIRVGTQTRKAHLDKFSRNPDQFKILHEYVVKRDLGLPLETKVDSEMVLKHFEQFTENLAKSAAQFSDLNFVHGSPTPGNRTTRGFPIDFGTFFAQDAHHAEDVYLDGVERVGQQAQTLLYQYVTRLHEEIRGGANTKVFKDKSSRKYIDAYWKIHDETLGELRLKRLGLNPNQIENLGPELRKEFSEATQKIFEARGKRIGFFSLDRHTAFDLRDILGKSIETANLPEADQKVGWENLFLTKRKWRNLKVSDLGRYSRYGKLMNRYSSAVLKIREKLIESGEDLNAVVETGHRIQRHVRRDIPFPDFSGLLKNIERKDRVFYENSLEAFALGNLLVDWDYQEVNVSDSTGCTGAYAKIPQ